MKTLVTSSILSAGLLLMGLNVTNRKLQLPEAKPELKIEEALKVSPRVYQPTAPTCPSAEYQLASLNRNAESQNPLIMTAHCPKCNLGALYKKGEDTICTYCESIQ